MDNANSPEYLEKIKLQVFDNLARTAHAPSVQMMDVPRTPLFPNDNPDDPDNEGNPEDLDEREARLDDEDEDMNKDTRYTERKWDKRVEHEGELSDSEDEDQNERNGVKRQPNGERRRPRITDHRNPYAPDEEDGINSGVATPLESGDDMALDGARISSQAVTSANAAVAEALLAAKASDDAPAPGPAQPTPGEEVASNRSRRASPVPAPDVDMAEGGAGAAAPAPAPPPNAPNAAAMGGQGPIATPPDSPPVAPAAAAAGASEDVVMGEGEEAAEAPETAIAREEGAAERNAQDVEAEKRREGDAPQGVI